MEERSEALLAMTSLEVDIVDVPKVERERLVPILEESFEGLYLWHSKRTLNNIEIVRAARTKDNEDAGLIMLKMLRGGAGYVYYVAVLPKFRGEGIGGQLLDSGLAYFSGASVTDIYASIEEDNVESNKLFASRGFEKLEGSAMNERYGRLRAMLMSQEMMLVRGEVLWGKRLVASVA